METVLKTILIGIGATLVIDLWALLLRKLFGIKSLDYRYVGRWILKFRHGKFKHDPIFNTPEVKGELAAGWCAHYLIGIFFAFVLVEIWGVEWIETPTLFPAVVVGIVTVIAPFFIMQPAFGIGFAASKTPVPNLNRFKSLLTHTVYGIGLYLTALCLQW